jgi:pimeloyl-ACP methyl ester carboxylesterase
VLVETALFSTSAEWWHLAHSWSSEWRIVLYDRAGYGQSTLSVLPRTPGEISREALALLDRLEIRDPILVLGHSQGGLYAQHHARAFPDRVRALVLLDPVCADNARLRAELSAAEYRASGIDKARNLRWGKRLCALGLGFALRPLLAQAPPFYYRRDFSRAARSYILDHATRASSYRTALAEYAILDQAEEMAPLRLPRGLPPIPLELLLSSPEVIIEETMHFGGADQPTAIKVQQAWHRLMQSYLTFSPRARLNVSMRGSHFLHLTAPDEVKAAMARAWAG